MNIRAFTLTLVLAMVLLAAFAMLNWVAMAAPTSLNLGFTDVTAPLGMVMLAFTAVIAGLFILYIVLLQANVILEGRRLTKDMHAQTELAQTAEASRFTALRAWLEGELARIEAQRELTNHALADRLAQSGRDLQRNLADTAGSLSAHLGEIEDKLDRGLGTVPATAAIRPLQR